MQSRRRFIICSAFPIAGSGIINRQSLLSVTLTVSLCLSVVVLKATLDGWPIVRAVSLDNVQLIK